jgi:hypothetical protein
MNYKWIGLSVISFIFFSSLNAQHTFMQPGFKESWLLNRLEIKWQTDPKLNFSHIQPFNRFWFTQALIATDSIKNRIDKKHCDCVVLPASAVDGYNIKQQLLQHKQYQNNYVPAELSKDPVGDFYTTPQHLYEVNNNDFYVAINPLLNQQQTLEVSNSQRVFVNAKGIGIRGDINKKIGFWATIVDVQERGPRYVMNLRDSTYAMPGAGFIKPFKTTGVDYFDATGGVNFSATKNVQLQVGFDRNFIGSGLRSLLMGNSGPGYAHIKLNTNIWKLNYQVMWMEWQRRPRQGSDALLPKKYSVFHHLSINAAPWLNVGLFEMVAMGRRSGMDLAYFNPLIFFRSVEQQLGSPDNAVVGIDAKANIDKVAQIYGSFILDEFSRDANRGGKNWWGKKYGYQIGLKYIDAFQIKNLDIQGEYNVVRPFTFSHTDSNASISHYNQPAGHILGSNFKELIAQARYQPFNKWYAEAKLIYYTKGLDSLGANNGGNILRPNTTRDRDYGYFIGNGNRTNVFLGSFWLGYELRPNLFLDASLIYRRQDTEKNAGFKRNTLAIGLGIRLNLARREFDF